jgi:hypothetical protein
MNQLTRVFCLVVLACGMASSAATEWQQAGITWYGGPDGSHVDDCAGNCGAGCSDHANPCGGPDQYWDLQFLDGPTYTGTETEQECRQTGKEVFAIYDITKDYYQAMGRWTYHGWVMPGCQSHDSICGWETFPLCAWWTGCGDYGWEDTWSYDEHLAGYVITREHYVGTYSGTC